MENIFSKPLSTSDDDSDDDGSISFSFTIDQDGEDVPVIKCPKCLQKDCEPSNADTDTYKCISCGNEFVPGIYQALNSADAYLGRAGYNFRKRNFKRTIKDCTAAIKEDSKNRMAYITRGKAHLESNEFEEAENDFTEAIRISPENDVVSDAAFFNRGQTRLLMKKFDEAVEDLTTSMNISPDFSETYKLRAIGLFNKGDYEGAIRDFSEAIQRKPDDVSALYQRGYTYSTIGEVDKAFDDFNEAIKIDPEQPDPFYRRAEIHEKRNSYPEAIADYKSYLRAGGKDSSDANEVVEKINSLQYQIDPNTETYSFSPDEEVPIWEDVTLNQETKEYRSIDEKQKSGETESITFEAALYAKHGVEKYLVKDYDGAIEDLTEAIRLDPGFHQFYHVRGLSYVFKDMNEEALKDLSEGIRLGSKEFTIYFYRAIIYIGEGKLEEAISDLDQSTNINPTSEAYYLRGLTHLQRGSRNNAISDFTDAIHLDPDKADYYHYRGQIFQVIEDFRAAISDFQMYLEVEENDSEGKKQTGDRVEGLRAKIDPCNLSSSYIGTFTEPKKLELAKRHIERGVQLYEDKKMAEALVEFQVAKNIDPTNAQPYEFSALIYLNNQDRENAISDLTEVIRIKPTDADAYLNRGACYVHLGNMDEAVQDFKAVIHHKPDHAPAYRNLGAIYLTQQKYDLAIEKLDKSIALDPSVPAVYLYRASAKERKGDKKAAIPDFQKYCDMGGGPEVPNLEPLVEHILDLRREYGS